MTTITNKTGGIYNIAGYTLSVGINLAVPAFVFEECKKNAIIHEKVRRGFLEISGLNVDDRLIKDVAKDPDREARVLRGIVDPVTGREMRIEGGGTTIQEVIEEEVEEAPKKRGRPKKA